MEHTGGYSVSPGTSSMRVRFLLPGIALAAFAATLAVIGEPDHGVVLVPVRAATPAMPSLGLPAATDSRQDAPAHGRDETSMQAPQSPQPDPPALPSYESDQAARN